MTAAGAPGSRVVVGDEIELDIGAIAHGGVCVARIGGDGGRVVFVRHGLPGERAVVRITEVRRDGFCRGDAVRIVRAHPERVEPPCAHFRPGGCGGCDWMHAAPELQRRLKAAVVAEQFERLAGEQVEADVEPLPGDGFGWRSRVRWGLSRVGEQDDVYAGPRRYRSHEVVPVNTAAPCLIAAPGLAAALAEATPVRGADEVALIRDGAGQAAVTWLRKGHPLGRAGQATVTQHVSGRDFEVRAAGFWQAHLAAAQTLSDAVAAALADVDLAERTAWDLYGGVGLFAALLADGVGVAGAVVSVESERTASALARRNLADLPQVRVVPSRVDVFVAGAVDAGATPQVVVLDPPRSGAGSAVCRGIAALGPERIVYVACDPAALARDAATLALSGYRRIGLRAFDAFPQTHHIECVAVFAPDPAPAGHVIDSPIATPPTRPADR